MRPYILLLSLCMLFSCGGWKEAATELFRGEIVAKVGDHRLLKSDLVKYIPAGVSAEDSAALARQYINTWAQDLIMLDMAGEQLSPEEKDVTEELEEYRRNLLKYRYEQLYINQRLDTLVRDAEIAAYYKANEARFRLERPVYKARYVIIPSDAKSIKRLKELMSSDNPEDLDEAAVLGSTIAIKYADEADTWKDAMTVALDAGVDYKALVSGIKQQFAQIPDDSGNLHIIYVAEAVQEGKTAPREYCEGRIKDLILSARKHELQENLQKELLEDATKNNKFVIY